MGRHEDHLRIKSTGTNVKAKDRAIMHTSKDNLESH